MCRRGRVGHIDRCTHEFAHILLFPPGQHQSAVLVSRTRRKGKELSIPENPVKPPYIRTRASGNDGSAFVATRFTPLSSASRRLRAPIFFLPSFFLCVFAPLRETLFLRRNISPQHIPRVAARGLGVLVLGCWRDGGWPIRDLEDWPRIVYTYNSACAVAQSVFDNLVVRRADGRCTSAVFWRCKSLCKNRLERSVVARPCRGASYLRGGRFRNVLTANRLGQGIPPI